ncbi:MAG: Ig-like domain-containing protein, partial [Nanoarchaeota archaeon]
LTTGGIGDSNSNPADPNALPLDYNSDDELYDLIPFVNNGDTNIDVYTLNPSNDDNIYFAGFFLGSTTAIIGEGILLGPSSAINLLGTNHTVTATVQDNLGNPIAGVNVTLDIISGPNAGLSGSGITDSEGKVYFTYSGSIVGTDVLRASFYNSEQKLITSNTVTKEWANQEKQEQTVVNGHIYAADGITPVSGTGVSVTCDGLGPLVDTTDSEGYYMVEFLEGCDLGDTVEVTSGGVSDTDTVANAVIWKNLVYVNLTVPEFGVITALAALAGSVLVFTVIRKRK